MDKIKNNMPTVAIIGRPNVGKSTFFNKLIGQRVAIVKDEVGVTRDRLYHEVEWVGYRFLLIDTGGISYRANDDMYKHMLVQANIAQDIATVIVFMVDGKVGVTQDDIDIAKHLKKTKKKVVLVVNKIDNFNQQELQYDFFSLGLGMPFSISCEQKLGLGDLLDEIVKGFNKQDESLTTAIRIAIVGRPNVGKSSIVNKLLGYERVVVSDVAGTTRDAVDTPYRHNNKDYVIVDTAGMRRQRSIEEESVESYGVMRAIVAIKQADVVLVVFDASEPLSEQDIRIAGLVHEQSKPSVIVCNKWDKLEKETHTQNNYKKKLELDLAFMNYFMVDFVSATTGQRIKSLIDRVDTVYANANKRLATSVLNDIIANAYALNPPSAPRGQRVKIYYGTQVDINPPKFVIFCNNAELVHNTYRRYLENSFRKAVDFQGTPLRLQFNNNKNKDIDM